MSCCTFSPATDRELISSTGFSPWLEKRGKIRNPSIDESSGLVKSRRWPNLFWTHNDSGDGPRIFAIRGDGSAVNVSGTGSGIQVDGAENVDWEDIAIDDNGCLIIGDIGNNVSSRSRLVLYRVKEPDPFNHQETARAEKVSIYFPDRPSRAFNSEALFWARGRIYLLTKTRRGRNTGLYRVDRADPTETVPLIRIGCFDFRAPVTASDTSPDGRFLAVLTYKAVWLFERPAGTENYLAGKKSIFPIRAWQCEAVCFDGATLLIGNEGGSLFDLDTAALLPLK